MEESSGQAETPEQTIARLTSENERLRQQVIKGKDIAKLLAEKYGDKLAQVQREHRAELAAARAASAPADASEELRETREALERFVELMTGRERRLNEWIRSLRRKLARRDAYIKQLEEEDDWIEERLCVIEGKARGVVREAHNWNARERQLIEKAKEDALLAVHLAQREQDAVKEHRNTRARLERSEKKIIELEEEIAQLTRYVAAAREGPPSGTAASPPPTFLQRLSPDPSSVTETDASNGQRLAQSQQIRSLSSATTDSIPPPLPRRPVNRRVRGHHQRSESLGSAMLQQISSSQSLDGVKQRSMEEPTLRHFVATPAQQSKASAEMSASMRVISPRSSAVDHLRATAPSVRQSGEGKSGGSNRGSAKMSRSNRKSLSKADAETVSKIALCHTSAADESGSVRRRRTKSLRVPHAKDEDFDGISAEALAEVEAEIAQLLAGGKEKKNSQ